MRRKVLVLDTSMFCVWLNVPGYERCGEDADPWLYDRINDKIQEEINEGGTLVLPLATIIESGNHISQSRGDCYDLARKFCDVLLSSVKSEEPWTAFSDQEVLWSLDKMEDLVESWPKEASQRVSLGDWTIRYVAEFYARGGYQVEILTGDKGLKSHEPRVVGPTPRRRS